VKQGVELAWAGCVYGVEPGERGSEEGLGNLAGRTVLAVGRRSRKDRGESEEPELKQVAARMDV
jgi:hypothetical protein